MRKSVIAIFVAGALFISGPVLAGEAEEEGYGQWGCYGPGMMWGGGHGWGPGMMWGWGGPQMGPGMMGPGMMWGGGYGWGPGRMWGWYGEEGQKFLDETASLRKEMHTKKFEYLEAWRKGDMEKAKSLDKELGELAEKLTKKAQEMGLYKDYPRKGYGSGMGPGMMQGQ